ncbi:MAG: sialate O-acetylesterase [Lunatimonas sp.]|uniref:sialate O-acetylesterase n=1 Tax=Lunatimonas sp. TaxID=2060141 RepID=UPI00263B8274|nr:sialate O-acetylesterase [Lunatimonas sp.]MCC5937984.1 sialate O-acetylesterase [Lunatimonas sp.]
MRTLKALCVICLLLGPVITGIAQQSMDIYLAIGQSNMAGRAEIPAKLTGEMPGVFLFTGDDMTPWLPAKNPLNLYSSIRKEESMQRLSPAYSFARSMAKKADTKLGLVVNARGGSAIAEWMPGTPFYRDLIQKAQEASTFGVIKGVIWHQGESDLGKLDTYLGSLETLIAHIRADLGLPELPFVAGEIAEDQAGRETFNQLIRRLPDLVSHTAVASSKGTKTFDEVHFDTKSQLKLGKRYAKQMIKLSR